MSEWIEVKKEDIEINDGQIEIWFESDDFGNRYIEFPVEFIKELLEPKDDTQK